MSYFDDFAKLVPSAVRRTLIIQSGQRKGQQYEQVLMPDESHLPIRVLAMQKDQWFRGN